MKKCTIVFKKLYCNLFVNMIIYTNIENCFKASKVR